VTEGVSLLVVDDHPVLVEGLLALLSDFSDIEVLGTAGSAAEALEKVAAFRPRVVLMDYRLPDGDGVAATAAILERHPDVAVVMLSADDSESAVFSAVEAGAVGYLVKSEAMGQIADAVRRAGAGEMLIPQAMLGRLVRQRQSRALDERQRERLLGALTRREIEVLRLMADGLDNQQIASRLFISYLTVRGHVRRILAKLDCHTKLAAVARAGEYGLLER
jgi:DNA-binding NarL/FixJ family response regulator